MIAIVRKLCKYEGKKDKKLKVTNKIMSKTNLINNLTKY